MNLGELIKFLESYPPEQEIKFGFANPHSYRGYYHCLAFELEVETSIGKMLSEAKACKYATFMGYKGGAYLMTPETDVYLSHYGSSRLDDESIKEDTLRQLFSIS